MWIEDQKKILIKRQRKLYVMRNKQGTELKIGIAVDPFKRLGELQVGNWNDLYVSLAIEVYRKGRTALLVEKRLHKKFKKNKIRGEWFDDITNKQIIDSIQEPKEVIYIKQGN